MIFECMARLSVSDVKRVIAIGDTPLDMQAGCAAGCCGVIGVLTGAHGIETLGMARHTHIIRSVADLPVLLEKGFLVDPYSGEIIWDVSGQFDHGQWIAHTPDPARDGRLVFISELWGADGKSAFFTGQGDLLRDIRDLPRTRLAPDLFPGWRVLPTRCHVVQWTPDAEPEIFMAEQACSPTSHDCFQTHHFTLRAFFLDLRGNLIATLPFEDAQIEGYWYNGEVRSRVADVDGDGQQEIVFPRQDGRVMVIVKRSGGDG